MSVVAEDPRMAIAAESNQFEYVPMTPLAPISALIGLGGLVVFYEFMGIPVAVFGLLLSLVAVRNIRKSEGAIGGKGLALVGLGLSLLSVFGGTAKFYTDYSTECPEGYERVNFPRQIAEREFTIVAGRRAIQPDVQELLDREIFLKGYMYQTRSTRNRRDFVLLKDSGECCFGGAPAPNDMIQVTLSEDLPPVNFSAFQMVSVAGILRADPAALEGQAVYTMEAHQCESARTSF